MKTSKAAGTLTAGDAGQPCARQDTTGHHRGILYLAYTPGVLGKHPAEANALKPRANAASSSRLVSHHHQTKLTF